MDNPNISASVLITVTSTIGVSSVSISPSTACMDLNDTLMVNATVFPANAADKTLIWNSGTMPGFSFSSHADQASLISFGNAGVVTITATSVDGGYQAFALVTIGGCNVTTTTGGNNCDPVHAGSIADGTGGALLNFPNSVYVLGNYAYVTSYNNDGALEIIDISNPAVPIHKGSLTHGTGGAILKGAGSIVVSGSFAYIACAGGNALEIVDISNPTAPIHKGSLTDGTGGALLNYPTDVHILGNYAYVASAGSDALEIIDISNPSSPAHKGSLTNGTGGALLDGPGSIFISGNYAYIASYNSNALEIIEVSDPSAPVHKGSLTDGTEGALLNFPYSVKVSGNYAYLVSAHGNALEIIDVSNSTNPIHKGSLSDGVGGALLKFPWSVYVSGNYAYVTSRDNNALEVVDISNPANPIHKGSLSNGSGGALLNDPVNVFVKNDYAYISSQYSNALEIVSLSCTTTSSNLTTPGNYFISIINSGSQVSIVNGQTIISWPTMTGASTFCIKYSADSLFRSNVVTVCGLISPNYTISGFGNLPVSRTSSDQEIYWQVAAVDDNTGLYYWSSVQNTSRLLDIDKATATRSLQLYPNPSNDYINILGLNSNDEILIYDVHGQKVSQTNTSPINISNLPGGIYIARINNKNLRFVKQ